MKTKLNPIILVGGILCLISMLFSYLSIKILGHVGVPIVWSTCARFLNHVLYVVPVAGVLILLGGLIDNKIYQVFATLVGLVVVVWYFIVYRNPLNGDAVSYVLGANVLLSEYVGTSIKASDLQMVAQAIVPFMHVGIGFILFIAGTCLSGIGIILNLGFDLGGGGSRSSGSKNTSKSYNQY